MRVLMVTSSYPKYPGDVTAPFIESIALAVAARGHQVDVVLPFHPELRRGEHEPVRFFPYRYAPHPSLNVWGYAQSLEADVRVRPGVYVLAPLAALGLRRALAARLAETPFEVAHVHWVVPNAVLARDLLASAGVPVVVSLHGSDVFMAERHAVIGGWARAALRHAGAVTACSGDLRERSLRLGARRERTRTVPYGVDLAAFAPRPDAAGVRARLGVPAGAFFVLGFGRLVEKKGFRHLVEAAARLPGVHVAIAGKGDLRRALEEQARALGAPVSFPGALERGDMAAALRAADAVAVPSVVDAAGNVDGLPNALLEALAAGKPVVASRVAGIPDVVEDGVSGLLAPPGDAAALAAALDRLRREPDTAARMGRAARAFAECRLSWDAAARAFEECYAQAAALATGLRQR